ENGAALFQLRPKSPTKLRPELSQLLPDIIRVGIFWINLQNTFQVLLGERGLFRLGVGKADVVVIIRAIRFLVLGGKLDSFLEHLDCRRVYAFLIESPA